MILSTWGANEAGFHTTSFAWRAAWARRTSHHAAVVARAVAVPARRNTSRRVSIHTSLRTPSLLETSPSSLPRRQCGGGQALRVRAWSHRATPGAYMGGALGDPEK